MDSVRRRRHGGLWAAGSLCWLLAACGGRPVVRDTAAQTVIAPAQPNSDMEEARVRSYDPPVYQPGESPDSSSSGRYGTDGELAPTMGTRTPFGGSSFSGGPADPGATGRNVRERIIIETPVGPRTDPPEVPTPEPAAPTAE